MADLDGLPGETLVRQGLEDLSRDRLTVEALTLAIASDRLRSCGLAIPPEPDLPDEPELALYGLLRASRVDDAYSRYNSLRRELDSFLAALEGRRRRAQQANDRAAG